MTVWVKIIWSVGEIITAVRAISEGNNVGTDGPVV